MSSILSPSVVTLRTRAAYASGLVLGTTTLDSLDNTFLDQSPVLTSDLKAIEADIALPVNGTATVLPFPAAWTVVRSVYLYNRDTTTPVALVFNGLKVRLDPNGGTFVCTIGAPLTVTGTALTPTSWTVGGVDPVSGGVPAPTQGTVYFFATGYI